MVQFCKRGEWTKGWSGLKYFFSFSCFWEALLLAQAGLVITVKYKTAKV